MIVRLDPMDLVLIGEPKLDAKRRVDISLDFPRDDQILRVGVELGDVLRIELDESLDVLLDSLRSDGFG